MQMNSVPSHHIVLGAWIWEVVDLYIVHDAFPDEAEAMLPNNYGVHCTLADKELALEILRLVDEACDLISVRICFRMVM